MSEVNLSPELQKQWDDFKEKWMNAEVEIIGIKHPWAGCKGVVISFDHTNAGVGMKVKLENGFECYVFKGTDIKRLNPLK